MPPRHLLLLYTATCGPPVSRPSLKPGIHLSRPEYLSLMHKYLSSHHQAYLFPPYICVSHISVSAKYLSQPNVFIHQIFVSQSQVFSLFRFQVTGGAACIFCRISFLRNCGTTTLPPLFHHSKLGQDQLGWLGPGAPKLKLGFKTHSVCQFSSNHAHNRKASPHQSL